MKDRLITALGALVALAIAYALFFQRPGEPPVTKPLSTEAGNNGYLGLWTWLERQSVKVVSLRERYGRLLEDHSLPDSGNLLIVTMPFRTPLRTAEIQPLQLWALNGNTVLIVAALDDSPDWLPLTDEDGFRSDLAALTGLQFMTPRERALADGAAQPGEPNPASDDGAPANRPAADPPSPSRVRFERPPIAAHSAIEIEPVVEHPLLAGVERLRGFSDDTSEVWLARNLDPYRLVLRLAKESSSGLDALWQLPRARGQVIVAASGSLLANRNIGEGDARELVRNLIRHHVASDGAVIFDDMHQGLSSLYDAAALFRDERLTYTIWFVLAAWIVYILGSSNRLAAPRAARTAPRQGDFLAAAGGFMARRLDKRAAGRLLMDEWLGEVRKSRGLPVGEPPWAELEATPTLARAVYEELHGFDRTLADGKAVDLVRLHNVLKQAREAIG